MTTILDGPEGLRAAVGTHLGLSDWLTIDQDRIDLFALATGDHPPDPALRPHVDIERAAAGPSGAPIAHGNLTLALTNLFLPQVVEVRGFTAGVNYGVDRVRYPAPVRVGSAVRGSVEMVEVTDVPGGLQTLMRITVEIRGEDGEPEAEPACAVDAVSRWLLD
jgi:acyl dehydratase